MRRCLSAAPGGGSGCIVRVWGCNGPVVGGRSGADGVFGPRTRAAIRSWQSSQGARATGYLDGAAVAALRPSASAASVPPSAARRLPAPRRSSSPFVLPLPRERNAKRESDPLRCPRVRRVSAQS